MSYSAEIWKINQQEVRNYGPCKFIVLHEDGAETIWFAHSEEHVKRLAQIEYNLGYILKPKKIFEYHGTQLNLF